MTDELPPQEMFKLRQKIAEHFQQKRTGLDKYKIEGLSAIFVKGRLLSIIANSEREAHDEAEKHHWKDVDAVLAKCDKEMEKELEPFISKGKLTGDVKE